ncbi:MAG: pyruvate kinase [candidate division Zixibacteria bacterium]|nr:pyruvate kinase [candidate division Zixibacteria bacterium]
MNACKTKIICTIGPATSSKDRIAKLIKTGMNVARLKFSHGTHKEHQKSFNLIRECSKKLNSPVAILMDLSGPKIRVGKLEDNKIQLIKGASVTLTSESVLGTSEKIPVSYPDLPKEVKRGDAILLNDGLIELKVINTNGKEIKCKVIVGGPLSSHKGINLTRGILKVRSLTPKDKGDLIFGIGLGVDFVALSFVRRAEDILEAKRVIEQHKAAIPVIAKIEKHEALKNIDSILKVADGLMVARGDLGVEIPIERIPFVQKMLIGKANQLGKPVITATQMLRSMVDHPRPTRAEVTDIANAICDGTDAIMLSEETAVGRYPIEAVKMMVKVARRTEKMFCFERIFVRRKASKSRSIPAATSHAACVLAYDLKAKAIMTCTVSGSTSRMVSKYRPSVPVLALTPKADTARRLSLVWGVYPVLVKELRDADDIIKKSMSIAKQMRLAKSGDVFVITAGVPIAASGTTNLIKIEIVE